MLVSPQVKDVEWVKVGGIPDGVVGVAGGITLSSLNGSG